MKGMQEVNDAITKNFDKIYMAMTSLHQQLHPPVSNGEESTSPETRKILGYGLTVSNEEFVDILALVGKKYLSFSNFLA